MIDPADFLFHGHVGEHGFHVVDVGPVGGGVFAVEESGFGEEEGAGADAGGELCVGGGGGDPVDDLFFF